MYRRQSRRGRSVACGRSTTWRSPPVPRRGHGRSGSTTSRPRCCSRSGRRRRSWRSAMTCRQCRCSRRCDTCRARSPTLRQAGEAPALQVAEDVAEVGRVHHQRVPPPRRPADAGEDGGSAGHRVVPPAPSSRPRVPDRQALCGILFVLHGVTSVSGPGASSYCCWWGGGALTRTERRRVHEQSPTEPGRGAYCRTSSQE